METPLNKVFFHEVGHFVAHQLNYKYFKIGQVDKIILLEKSVSGRIEYEGRTIPKIPQGKSNSTPLINLPEKIAELIYGCYFQSLYLNQPLENCFNNQNSYYRGYQDFQDMISALTHFKTSPNVRKILYPFIQIEYFKYLQSNRKTFIPIFQQNPSDFLIKTDLGYKVNIDKLNSALIDFIDAHGNEYLNFIKRIKEILNWKNGG